MKTYFTVVAIALMSIASGCASSQVEVVDSAGRQQARFGLVRIDSGFSYIIDPQAEMCFLAYGPADIEPVDCMTLKKNLPKAGEFMSWLNAESSQTRQILSK